MKKIKVRRLMMVVVVCLSFCIGSIGIAAAGDKPVPPKPIKEMTDKEIVDYGIQLFLGFTGDEHTPLDKFAEDATFTDVTRPVKKVFKGKKEIAQFLQDYAGMSGWGLEILNSAYAGNGRIGIEWIWTSVHDLGPYDGIPARGIKTSIVGSTWLTINDEGLIQDEKDIWNREHLVHQLCAE